VVYAGYFFGFTGLFMPSFRRWRSVNDRWLLTLAYLKGIDVDTRSLWTAATQPPAVSSPGGE